MNRIKGSRMSIYRRASFSDAVEKLESPYRKQLVTALKQKLMIFKESNIRYKESRRVFLI